MKNNKNIGKLKMKAGVLLVVWLLIAVAVSGVLGGTVTNTDIKTVTSDSDMIIDYQNGSITAHNITVLEQILFNGTTPRWINDSSDSKDTLISNSNGKYWSATQDNLQDAIDDAGAGGEVILPDTMLECYNAIWINSSLNNFTISTLGNGTLKAMTDFSTHGYALIYIRANDVTIDGITFNGNQLANVTEGLCSGIFIADTRRLTVKNCYFHNTTSYAIEVYRLNDSLITHNTFRNLGNFTNNDIFGGGIRFESGEYGCFNNTISYNLFDHIQEHAIKMYATTDDAGKMHRNRILYNTFRSTGDIFIGAGYTGVIQMFSEGDSAIGNTLTVENWAEGGIMVDGDNNTVSGNTIMMKPGNEDGRYAISLIAGATHNIVTNNEVRGYTTSQDTGIYLIGGNKHNLVSGNQLHILEYPFRLRDDSASLTEWNIITNNVCSGDKIWLQAGVVRDNLIQGNDFTNCTNGVVISSSGSNIFKDNIGYTTESSGLCTVLDDSTSIVVSHNMSIAPTYITASPRDNMTSATFWYIDTVTSTQFTLHVNDDVTADVSFYWKAEYN